MAFFNSPCILILEDVEENLKLLIKYKSDSIYSANYAHLSASLPPAAIENSRNTTTCYLKTCEIQPSLLLVNLNMFYKSEDHLKIGMWSAPYYTCGKRKWFISYAKET